MAFFPGFPSVPLLCCSFRSKFRCFCRLPGVPHPALHALPLPGHDSRVLPSRCAIRGHIQYHIKVKGTASPYDGNLPYWSQRLSRHPLLNGTKGKLLQKQGGKCLLCGLHFQDDDIIEIDHIIPRSQGGGEEHSNKIALHRHCHDERHARRAAGTSDKGQITEEPCDGKLSRTVLEPSGGGDSFA